MVTMTGKIWAGAAAPEKLRFTFPGPAGVNLNDVTAVTADLYRPSGNITRGWTFGIDPSRSAGRITVVRIFAANGKDLPEGGNYALAFYFAFSGGVVRRSEPVLFPVSPYPWRGPGGT